MTPFPDLLRTYRKIARLSQSRLAEAAGFDHSYLSRLESGNRKPTRDAVDRLCIAMGLDQANTEALLRSAGFIGVDDSTLLNDPDLRGLAALLQDAAVPDPYRAFVRTSVRGMIEQAQLVRQAVTP